MEITPLTSAEMLATSQADASPPGTLVSTEAPVQTSAVADTGGQPGVQTEEPAPVRFNGSVLESGQPMPATIDNTSADDANGDADDISVDSPYGIPQNLASLLLVSSWRFTRPLVCIDLEQLEPLVPSANLLVVGSGPSETIAFDGSDNLDTNVNPIVQDFLNEEPVQELLAPTLVCGTQPGARERNFAGWFGPVHEQYTQ